MTGSFNKEERVLGSCKRMLRTGLLLLVLLLVLLLCVCMRCVCVCLVVKLLWERKRKMLVLVVLSHQCEKGKYSPHEAAVM